MLLTANWEPKLEALAHHVAAVSQQRVAGAK